MFGRIFGPKNNSDKPVQKNTTTFGFFGNKKNTPPIVQTQNNTNTTFEEEMKKNSEKTENKRRLENFRVIAQGRMHDLNKDLNELKNQALQIEEQIKNIGDIKDTETKCMEGINESHCNIKNLKDELPDGFDMVNEEHGVNRSYYYVDKNKKRKEEFEREHKNVKEQIKQVEYFQSRLLKIIEYLKSDDVVINVNDNNTQYNVYVDDIGIYSVSISEINEYNNTNTKPSSQVGSLDNYKDQYKLLKTNVKKMSKKLEDCKRYNDKYLTLIEKSKKEIARLENTYPDFKNISTPQDGGKRKTRRSKKSLKKTKKTKRKGARKSRKH